MEEPTVHIHTVVDIRTFAKVLSIITSRNLPHKSSWSHIIRLCVEEVATMAEREFDVNEALEFVKSENFPIRQLLKRGKGIRSHIGVLDVGKVPFDSVDSEAMGKIMKAMEGGEKG